MVNNNSKYDNHFEQWHKNMLIGEKKIPYTGKNVKVGIIDSGIDIYHPDLHKNINLEKSRSFVGKHNNILDYIGHGTQIAGTLVSIAPNIEVIVYKVIDLQQGDSSNVLKAILQAIEDEIDVINISLGTYKHIKKDQENINFYNKVIETAEKNGALVVSSTGNDSLNLDFLYHNQTVHLPSYINNVISVTSLNKNKKISSFSNYYTTNNLYSPGGDFIQINNNLKIEELIYTTYPTYLDSSFTNGYSFTAGGSIASASMSAFITLIIEHYSITNKRKPQPNEIKKLLFSSTNEGFPDIHNIIDPSL